MVVPVSSLQMQSTTPTDFSYNHLLKGVLRKIKHKASIPAVSSSVSISEPPSKQVHFNDVITIILRGSHGQRLSMLARAAAERAPVYFIPRTSSDDSTDENSEEEPPVDVKLFYKQPAQSMFSSKGKQPRHNKRQRATRMSLHSRYALKCLRADLHDKEDLSPVPSPPSPFDSTNTPTFLL